MTASCIRTDFRCLSVLLLALSASAQATVIKFDSDPFAGSTALTTPGRQVIGGEPSVSFSVANDKFVFDPLVFGAGAQIRFVNDVAANVPSGGVNVVVLQTIDNDGNPATPFGAGNAANLIAAQIDTPGAGFFIYFNSTLDLPRLVFSTDLSDNTADLKILARLPDFSGNSSVLPTFTAANFAFVPEPSSALLLAAPLLWLLGSAARRTLGSRVQVV